MRTALQTLWYSLATIAVVITILVGLLTIIEKLKDMIVGTYRQFIALRLSRTAKRILDFTKRTHPMTYYKVDEIATALNLTIRKTWDALEKLESENKVIRDSADQAIGGALWMLDELER